MRGWPWRLSALAGVPGRHVSALVVLVWSLLTAASTLLDPWTTALLVAAAAPVMAHGWPQLTRVPVLTPSRVVCALAGAGSSALVLSRQDLSVSAPLLGLAVVAAAVVVVLGPAPSGPGSAPAAPAGPGPGATAAPAPGVPAVASRTRSHATSHSRPHPPALPAVLALPATVCCLLIAVGGSTWVALAVRSPWAPTVPLACLMASFVVFGDQIGSTFRSNSIGALVTGAVSGVVTGLALDVFDVLGPRPATLLPGLTALTGAEAALPIFGLVTGVAVAVAIIAVDGLLGDHPRRTSRAGAVSRGTAKFLVAVLPIYALIRIGGI